MMRILLSMPATQMGAAQAIHVLKASKKLLPEMTPLGSAVKLTEWAGAAAMGLAEILRDKTIIIRISSKQTGLTKAPSN